MRQISLIILLILLPLTIKPFDYFTRSGKPHNKVVNKTRTPKRIIDTITVVGGKAVFTLNDNFKKGKHNVSATDSSTIYGTITQVLADTSKNVYVYSYYPSKDGKSITIKSSGGATDTSLVVVNLFVK